MTLRTFREEQLADQFRYFNFSSHFLVWTSQEKHPVDSSKGPASELTSPFKKIVAGQTLVSKMKCEDRDPVGQTGTGGLNMLMIIAPPFKRILYHIS